MYEAFYRLHTKPFLLSPDPRFFFSSRVHLDKKHAFAAAEIAVVTDEMRQELAPDAWPESLESSA
jgi:hypothetical protein